MSTIADAAVDVLADVAAGVEHTAAAYTAAVHERDRQILHAVDHDGVGVTTVARAVGLSRNRVYVILDQQRTNDRS